MRTIRRLTNLTGPEAQQKAAQLIPNRNCLICRSPYRAEIEGAWLKEGLDMKALAARWPFAHQSTFASHWRRGHPEDTLGADFKGHYDSRGLTQILQSWISEIEEIFDEARGGPDRNGDKDHKIALKAIEQIGQFLERYGKATGELKSAEASITVNIGSEQAQRMVGAANELELAEEYERRALLLRQRWGEKMALEAKSMASFPESPGVITDAVVVEQP